jgi:hypothetical protein
VALAGDSIFDTIDVLHERERVADRLRALLAEAGRPDACVLDGSWGGYEPVQQLAMLRWLATEHHVDVAVVDVWKSDRRLRAVGDRLYDAEAVAHAADGTPTPPLPLPHALHRWLLPRSRLWELATLTLASPSDPGRDPAEAYLEASAWSADHGVALVLAEAPPLDRPLATSAAERAAAPPDAPWERLRAAAEGRGQRYVVLADALKGADVERIRYDTCCHYVHEGHDLVARALLPHVLAALPARTASSGTP